MGLRDSLDILLIATIKPRSAQILSRMDIGSRMSIATSAAGRAYLASLAADERTAMTDEVLAATAYPTVSQARLEQSLQEYAAQGFLQLFRGVAPQRPWAGLHPCAAPRGALCGELWWTGRHAAARNTVGKIRPCIAGNDAGHGTGNGCLCRYQSNARLAAEPQPIGFKRKWNSNFLLK